MKGRDLIIYIMEHNLENEDVFKDDKLVGFLTVTDAAKKYKVGESTVRTWCELGYIKHIAIGELIFIPDGKDEDVLVK